MKIPNPFNVEIPEELVTTKAKVAYWILWQFYLTDLGRGQIFGKFTQLFTEVTLLLLVLDKVGMANISLFTAILMGLIGAFMVWFGGWLYQYNKIDQIGNLLKTKRDPIFMKMYDEVNNSGKSKSKDGK